MSAWTDAVAALGDTPTTWYKLDDTSGTTAVDASGNANHGTLNGSWTLAGSGLVPGDPGGSSAATAASSTGTYLQGAGAVSSRTFTLVFTYKGTDTTGGLVESAGVGGNKSRLFYNGTTVEAEWAGLDTTLSWAGGAAVLANNAAHLVIYRGSIGAQKLDVDGSTVASNTLTGGAETTGAWRFARDALSQAQGAYDEILLFDTYLSDADVAALATAWAGAASLTGTASGSASSDALASGDKTVHGTALGSAASSANVTGSSEVFGTAAAEGRSDATGDGTTANVVSGTAHADATSDATASGDRVITGTILGNAASDALIDGLASTGTDTTNRVGGRVRLGLGVATWSPPVVAPPASAAPEHAYDVALAHSAVEFVNGRPVYDLISACTKRPWVRILVSGKDVTNFRDAPTPEPSYRRIEPLVYGAGVLAFPQITWYDEFGVGDLRWLRPYAPVVFQLVDRDTNEIIDANRYRGFITDFAISGGTLVCELGGEVSGRADLMDKQRVLFRSVKDVGLMISHAVRTVAPVQFDPPRGPVTGIELAARGSRDWLSYISEVLALSGRQSGAQYTVGRRTNGTWGMWRKDVTTIDATIYLDDAQMVGDLHRALAEEPNRVFMSGTDPEGRRVQFAAYPGLKQGPPAPYPMDDGSPFGADTTDAETDSGDGITVMSAHMVTMGYLGPEDRGTTFDAPMTSAVRHLQRDADLAVTGVMNPATWDALWDLSATGYSLSDSRIEPAAQRSVVKPWRLSASGAIIGRNPLYRAHVPKVDHTVNVGAGFRRRQMRDWAVDEIEEGATPNWVGTITCHLAAIAGEHNPGDPLTDADVLPMSAITEGMNVWVPNHQGGTLFHVSGVEQPPGGGATVLTVDTRARDTMAAWECITRNRESRSNPARAWLNSNRSSDITKDTITEWDDVAGVVDDTITLASGWNSFPVVAGQAGTIARIRTALEDDATRYVLLVSTREITPARLTAWNPQPLTEAGSAKWDKLWLRNALEDRGLVYLAGSDDQPCGYWPGKQTGDDGEPTGDPITGMWRDDTSVGYYTEAQPVLYVAIYALEPSRLPAGRIMWNQLEAGS